MRPICGRGGAELADFEPKSTTKRILDVAAVARRSRLKTESANTPSTLNLTGGIYNGTLVVNGVVPAHQTAEMNPQTRSKLERKKRVWIL
jgi:hypothetical protein